MRSILLISAILATSCVESTAEPKTPADVAAIVEAVGKVSCKDLLANTLENPPSDVVRRARSSCKAFAVVSSLVNGEK